MFYEQKQNPDKSQNQHFERQQLNYLDVSKPQECQNRIRRIRNIQIDTSDPISTKYRLNFTKYRQNVTYLERCAAFFHPRRPENKGELPKKST